MDVAVALLTRDLRVHDNPTLAMACRVATHVVPLFVVDPSIPAPPVRRAFLSGALADLRGSFRRLGGDLIIRQGDVVEEAMRLVHAVGAHTIVVAHDVSRLAQRRADRLRVACGAGRIQLLTSDAVTIVPPMAVRTQAGGHYRVFTPYWRVWRQYPWRSVENPQRRLNLPPGLAVGRLPPGTPAGATPTGATPAGATPAGETAALRRARRWDGSAYGDTHDDLAGDRTSRLSHYLHFGCLSARWLAGRPLPEEFVRQLCWRDFFHQVCAGFPQLVDTAIRPGARDRWAGSDADFQRWIAGETGVALVDAGMRQLAAEGWMHNRARLVTASYLTKDLHVDWRRGAAHFMETLIDGDIANNYGNWQWVAGTGNDPRPNRRFNPYRQADRYDPAGAYRDRWLSSAR